MKTKKLVFLILLYGYVVLYMFKYFQFDMVKGQPFQIDGGTECGEVVANYSETRKVKHGYNDDYYLKVKYPDRTAILNVDGSTWVDSQVGDRVCFGIDVPLPFIYLPAICIGFISLFALLIYVFVRFIGWIFDIKDII